MQVELPLTAKFGSLITLLLKLAPRFGTEKGWDVMNTSVAPKLLIATAFEEVAGSEGQNGIRPGISKNNPCFLSIAQSVFVPLNQAVIESVNISLHKQIESAFQGSLLLLSASHRLECSPKTYQTCSFIRAGQCQPSFQR